MNRQRSPLAAPTATPTVVRLWTGCLVLVGCAVQLVRCYDAAALPRPQQAASVRDGGPPGWANKLKAGTKCYDGPRGCTPRRHAGEVGVGLPASALLGRT